MKPIQKYFNILGVDSNVTPKQLKKAYRNLVKEWHPDRFLHNPNLYTKAQEKLQEINEAYDQLQSVVSNPKNRSWQSPKESKPYATSGPRGANNATSKWPAGRSSAAVPDVSTWQKNCLWLWRVILHAVRDPWLITVLILMLALAVVVDWFYRLN